jgi:CRISPR-associated protein Csh2
MSQSDTTQTQIEDETDADEGIDTVSNRSEIIFLFDAVDCNPNGNPLSDANRPRIDTQTNQVIVTDVCLKQYIRQQFIQDGKEGVYVAPPPQTAEEAPTRTNLLVDVLRQEIGDVDDADDIDESILDKFYAGAIDVRLFGATLSFKSNNDDSDVVEAVKENLLQHVRGPVQFSPGRSMHPVEVNENYNSLSSVIATGEGKQQGGFALDDQRIKYGYIRFHSVINENGAADTHLTDEDVEYFDHTVWRGLKNQTNSRAKKGQEPRVYLRVEYAKDNFHLGDLHHEVTLDQSEDDNGNQLTKSPEKLRTIRDTCLNITPLCETLAEYNDLIETVHVAVDRNVQARNGDAVGMGDFLVEQLRETLGDDHVTEIDVRAMPDKE